MNSTLAAFGQVAQRLARNPIGIIALFIVLIYGFAALLLGTSGDTLGPDQRWPLVWFIVLFPIIVLLAFYRLVTNHHQKLYAPMDYRDERLFFRSLPPDQQRERVDREIDEVRAEGNHETESADPTTGPLPPVRRELYLLAEELVFRQLEMEFGRPINRQISVSGHPGLVFDGGLVTDKGIVFVEVKFVRQPLYSPRIVRQVLSLLSSVRAALRDRHIILYLAVVADMDEQHQRLLEDNIRKFIEHEASDVELRVFNLAELKKRFGIDAS